MNTDRKSKFRILFEEYYPVLCNLAYGYVGDKNVCEDIVQETLLALWNREKDLLPKGEFLAYAKVSVKNNSLTYLRRRSINAFSIDSADVFKKIGQIPEEENISKIKDNAPEILDGILKILPPKCGTIFRLNKLQGMKYREIASALRISEKTVDNQMGKAIRLLRKYAAEHPGLIYMLIIVVTVIKCL